MRAVLLHPLAEHREGERFDEVLEHTELRHLPHGLRVAHAGDGDHVHGGGAAAQRAEHIDAGAVGHRDVEQNEVERARALEHGRHGGTGTRAFAGDLEPFQTCHIVAMQFEGQRIVVDDEGADHCCDLRGDAAGRMTRNVVGSSLTVTEPPAPITTERTSARPMPRPCASAGFVE